MVIYTVFFFAVFFRKGQNPGIVVSLPAGNHFSKSIVRPYMDHILRELQISLLIQLHRFTVEIRTAQRLRIFLFYHFILYPDQAAHQLSPGFIRIIPGIRFPEGAVHLAPESQIPYHIHILLFFHSLLPQRIKFVAVLRKGGIHGQPSLPLKAPHDDA